MSSFWSLYFSNLISYLFGKFAFCNWPKFILRPILYIFCFILKIDLTSSNTPFTAFKSLNDLFIRFLTPSSRPWNQDCSVFCSPVDGTILEITSLLDKTLSVKGILYNITDLIGSELPSQFKSPTLINIYLSPKDCHRIFTPYDLSIQKAVYIPGKLLPVNPLFLKLVPNLYANNERIVFYATLNVENKELPILIILVGALNVGHMTVECDKTFYSNKQSNRNATEIPLSSSTFKKGDLLATFNLGSTALIVVDDHDFTFKDFNHHHPIKYGESLATFSKKL